MKNGVVKIFASVSFQARACVSKCIKYPNRSISRSTLPLHTHQEKKFDDDNPHSSYKSLPPLLDERTQDLAYCGLFWTILSILAQNYEPVSNLTGPNNAAVYQN